jgi:CDGSH-type Zn-finger protein
VVQQPDGTVIRETEKAFLCRCGFSEKKPFCDGSHTKKNWKA